MTNKLQKSIRNYRVLLARMPLSSRCPEFKHAADYLRSLYSQFGRESVRRAIKEAQHGKAR